MDGVKAGMYFIHLTSENIQAETSERGNPPCGGTVEEASCEPQHDIRGTKQNTTTAYSSNFKGCIRELYTPPSS